MMESSSLSPRPPRRLGTYPNAINPDNKKGNSRLGRTPLATGPRGPTTTARHTSRSRTP